MKKNIIRLVLLAFIAINASFADSNTVSVLNSKIVINTSLVVSQKDKNNRLNLSNSDKVFVVFLGAILVAAIAVFAGGIIIGNRSNHSAMSNM